MSIIIKGKWGTIQKAIEKEYSELEEKNTNVKAAKEKQKGKGDNRKRL